MSDSVLDLNPADAGFTRQFPGGEYEGYVVGHSGEKTNQNGKSFVVFEFRAEAPLSGQDLEGVNTDRVLNSERLYLNEAARRFSNDRMNRFGVEPASTYAQWWEDIVGAKVRFTVEVQKNENTKKEYRVVTDWRAA